MSIILLFSVVAFSSFKAYPVKLDIEKESKTSKTENEESKTELTSLEYEATVSTGIFFSPLHFSKIIVTTFVVFSEVSKFDFNFKLKSQEFYRIIFTHIISKNAP